MNPVSSSSFVSAEDVGGFLILRCGAPALVLVVGNHVFLCLFLCLSLHLRDQSHDLLNWALWLGHTGTDQCGQKDHSHRLCHCVRKVWPSCKLQYRFCLGK